jgi:hypothetical protein
MKPLHDLRTRLVQLHKRLLDEEQSAYEDVHGLVASGPELLQLALYHEQFVWLRSLSAMISVIDEALDETEGDLPDAEVEILFRRVRQLLRSGGDSPFETKYREALQRSPDVVMAHAAVVKLL